MVAKNVAFWKGGRTNDHHMTVDASSCIISLGLGFGSGGGIREIGKGQRHETDFLYE